MVSPAAFNAEMLNSMNTGISVLVTSVATTEVNSIVSLSLKTPVMMSSVNTPSFLSSSKKVTLPTLTGTKSVVSGSDGTIKQKLLSIPSLFVTSTGVHVNEKSSVKVYLEGEHEHIGGEHKQLGVSLGTPLGAALGLSLGLSLGKAVGNNEGVSLGLSLGESEGDSLGILLGLPLGKSEGALLGLPLGLPLGESLGTSLGESDGTTLGTSLGEPLGTSLGESDETSLGTSLGPVPCCCLLRIPRTRRRRRMPLY